MILTVAAVAGPVCVGVIGTYIFQQKTRPPEQRQLATHSSSPLTETNMNQVHQLQSLIPSRGGLLAALRSLFPRRAHAPSQMRVVDTVTLGPRDRAYVIEVGESWIVVGQGGNGLSALGTLRKGGTIATDARPPAPLIDTIEGARIEVTPALERTDVHPSQAPAVLDSMTRFLSALPAQKQSELPLDSAAPAAPVAAMNVAQEQPEQALATAASSADGGEELIAKSVTQMREMLSAAASGEMPGSVARDDEGFPDVVEAVKAVSAVEPVAESAAQAQEPAATGRRSFLQMYSEVKNNA